MRSANSPGAGHAVLIPLIPLKFWTITVEDPRIPQISGLTFAGIVVQRGLPLAYSGNASMMAW